MNTLCVKFPSITSRSLPDTERLGSALAKNIYPGLLILLYGDLGAGKTRLAIEIGKALGVENVKSPTFAIEAVYRLPDKAFLLVHADLYRLDKAESAIMQLDEYLEDGQVVLVEWADKWGKPPLENRWDAEISQSSEEDRVFSFSACGEFASAQLSQAYAEMTDALKETGPCR